MSYRTSAIEWIDASKELPTTDEFGPYPTALVALACVSQPAWAHRIMHAELRFFGGNKSRPYWADTSKITPIENDTWHVAYWAPCIKDPKQ